MEENLEEYMERRIEQRLTELKLRNPTELINNNTSTVSTNYKCTTSLCLSNTSHDKPLNNPIKNSYNGKKNLNSKKSEGKKKKVQVQKKNKGNPLSVLSSEINKINKKLDSLNSKVIENEIKYYH